MPNAPIPKARYSQSTNARRAREHATSHQDCPSWEPVQAQPRLDPGRFTIRSLPRRLKAMKDDPLLEILSLRPDLNAALEALVEKL